VPVLCAAVCRLREVNEDMGRIAILGGTGPEGLGLGLRFALCGEEVVIGSRQASRAVEAAEGARARLQTVGCTTPISGAENPAAVRGVDAVVIATPFAGASDFLVPLAPALEGMLVLDVVNPLIRAQQQFTFERLPEGSAAETIQRLLPRSIVVSAFKNESAEKLNAIEHPMDGDVVVCGNDPDGRARVMALVERVPRLRAVDGGPLINARSLEAITALLLNINRRHRAVTSIQIVGLPARRGAGAGQQGPQGDMREPEDKALRTTERRVMPRST
jgi:8-hydroxy-5-deazaflavin:NADPH oxidoreductase